MALQRIGVSFTERLPEIVARLGDAMLQAKLSTQNGEMADTVSGLRGVHAMITYTYSYGDYNHA